MFDQILNTHKRPVRIDWMCYCHITYEVPSESTLYSLPAYQGTRCTKQAPYLNFKHCDGMRTRNCLVRTLSHLAQLAKWLSSVVSTYIYRTFKCMLLCHVPGSEWMHTNVKELLPRNRSHIWSLSDWNGIRAHNNLVRKWTLKSDCL